MYPKSFEYLRAKSVDQALQYLKENEGSRVIAGGQSLVPMLKSRLYQPTVLVDINFIPELREVKLESNGDLRIGAMVTHYDVIENSIIRENAPHTVINSREHCGCANQEQGYHWGKHLRGRSFSRLSSHTDGTGCKSGAQNFRIYKGSQG